MTFSPRSRQPPRPLRLEVLESRELLTVVMTPQEQLIVELVNRARADPTAESQRYGIDLNDGVAEDRTLSAAPKQPLAPNQALTIASGLHAEDMLQRDYFGHDTPEGVTPSDRAAAAGYPSGAGENIAWAGESRAIDRNAQVYQRHEGLFLSVGHRENMMRARWREIGPAVRYGTFSQFEDGHLSRYDSIMVGTLFGNRGGENFITGVALSDAVDDNQFYEIGEGLGGVTITAVNAVSGASYSEVTGPSGGYALQVPPGFYSLTARGGALTKSLHVLGVRVSNENKKIDFNTLRMPTGGISGELFEDNNGNGRRDANEAALADRTVYLDYDDDGRLDDGEPTAVSDGAGQFAFQDLWPGEYTVRQQLPEGWRSTTLSDAATATLEGENDVTGVPFSSRANNLAPRVVDDAASVVAGIAASIDVLANDSDPDGDLAPDSLVVESGPSHGQASLTADGLTYVADADFAGVDAFRYSVADSTGVRSSLANVQITVMAAGTWHNLAQPNDVNGDGMTATQDVLLVIRQLNLHGPTTLLDQSLPAGPPFLDVSGDGVVTSRDALLIIRELNRVARLRATAAAADDLLADFAAWTEGEKSFNP